MELLYKGSKKWDPVCDGVVRARVHYFTDLLLTFAYKGSVVHADRSFIDLYSSVNDLALKKNIQNIETAYSGLTNS